MMTPAHFEDAMQSYEEEIKKGPANKEAIRKKAMEDAIYVLNQHGYTAGAEIFRRLIDG